MVPKSGATANTSSQQELIAANTLPTTIAQVTPNNTIVQEPALSKSEINLIAAEIQKPVLKCLQLALKMAIFS